MERDPEMLEAMLDMPGPTKLLDECSPMSDLISQCETGKPPSSA